MTMRKTDEQLMETMQKEGQRMAWEELYNRYRQPLYGYLTRLCGSAESAEDLFQETFIRVYQKRQTYRRGKPVQPWLYRIATNLFLDAARKRKATRSSSLDAPRRPAAGEHATVGNGVANGRPGPYEQAAGEELRRHLQQALDSLSPQHRAVFVMYHFQGLSYEDIALALSVSTGTVKSRMHYAAVAVHEQLRRIREGASR